ncbi:hypothetical protein GKZ89_16510 [Bacillus mangrovi]|uniref:Group-specific protein n=1 Tax=Metabacillus mangrovi TaxID=1491830 RepID=A0A7X2S7D8_9BACI|nr:hypothetical protein [Metabacillus mangrovi]MTH55007.1 hypothetical protein [Metabacillus mangrovi]
MDINKNSKMELLKRKTKRKNLIKQLDSIHFTEEPFLDMDQNDIFCKKVFALLEQKQDKMQIHGEDYQENINKSISILKSKLTDIDDKPPSARLFFFRENEIEAILVSWNEIVNNLNRLLEISNFSNGYADFILVTDRLDFGICIERTEHFYEYSLWMPSAN